MKLARSALALSALAVACAGPGAKTPGPSDDALTKSLASAFDEEAKGSPEAALRMYLDVVEGASESDGSPWQVVTLQAALDALVLRSVPALADISMDTALAFRAEKVGKGSIAARLAAVYAKAKGPFARGLLARAMLDLAEHGGDPKGAAEWRARTGCAMEATVIGPLTWAPVTGVHEVDPLESFDAKVAPAYSTVGAFAHAQPPVIARGRGCSIDLAAPSPTTGVRDVVVDVAIEHAGLIGVAIRSRGAATLRVGGKIVLDRPYELGGDEVPRFARVATTPGKLRFVARVGVDEDGETLEIDAWDDQGAPLHMQAPRANEGGNVRVVSAEALLSPSPKTDAERIAVAAASLASGDGRTAERLLERLGATAPPDMQLLYARAVETANDLSSVNRSERARAAYEKVLDAWPGAWEAILAHAVLAGVRRGEGDARIETLRDLDERRAKAGSSASPILEAFDAATSGRERLYDRSHAAFNRAQPALENTSLLVDAGRIASERVGTDRAAYACSPLPPHDRRSLDCYQALRDSGNLPAAGGELDRLRSLRGGDALFLSLTLRDALAVGDAKGAARALGRMDPGEATLSDLYGAATLGQQAAPDLYGRLHDALTIARDAPSAWPALLSSLEKDPIASFAGIAEALSQVDRARPMPEDAATAVLAHTEKYDVDASGIVHAILFDVRRVSGTTDVEENAQAEPPDLLGRSTLRVLRRRILKRDGRIVEPDPTPRAAQGHADLSQLEAGDLIEAIYESWAVPNEAGDVGIDTPDMLPERTAVHDGVIELRLPVSLNASLWTHPIWGKATQSMEGTQRVLTYRMKDQPVRRIEEGTPRMDRSVALSFGTAKWAEVAAGLREALASLDEHDPEIAAWTEKAISGLKDRTPRAEIAAIVLAAGVAVKEAAAGALTDVALGRATGSQTTTARTIVTSREGSRTWLIVRALRELGIRAEVVIAENEPFSESTDFPPHVGRFLHPLAVAHLAASGSGDELVWIDADVPGPPLPAGRISPELRGRSAIHADGSIAPLPVLSSDEERDEIDLRLTVDPNGDAKGTFTVFLRGREAQEIAEMLLRTVGDERQKALRGVALAWVPFANVDDVVLSSSEESWQIALRADLTIPSYAEVAGVPSSRTWLLPGLEPLHSVFPRGSASTLGATYAGQGKRQSALAVSHAVQYHAHRRVELPPGASLVSLPGPFEVRTARLEASRKLAVSGAVVEDDFVLGVPTGTILSNDYETFVADVHRTDDAFLAATRVKPAIEKQTPKANGGHTL